MGLYIWKSGIRIRYEITDSYQCLILSNMFLSILTAYVKVTMTPAFWRFQEEGYWKVISGGVFNLRYSKKKKEIYSGSDNRPPQPAPDDEGLSSL